MVKQNFNTCFHSFLNKFVEKIHWISIIFFSFCIFMFSYVLVHFLLYIYIVSFVLYGSFHLVLPPLTWYAWFFFWNSMPCLFLLFCPVFYWRAVGVLEMNKGSFSFCFIFIINCNKGFSVRKLPSVDCSLNEANIWEEWC